MKFRTLLLGALTAAAGLAAQSGNARSILVDNPTTAPPFGCEVLNWVPSASDPFASQDGNGTSSFFNPGTNVSGDNVAYCQPGEALATIWANDTADPPNLASDNLANTDLTATNGELYVWQAAGQENPDAEVIAWTLPVSGVLPTGGVELELNNWCGTNQNGDSPNSAASVTWSGTTYTDSCATNGTATNDLLFNGSGALIGFVDDIPSDAAFGNAFLTSSVPGWSSSAITSVPEPNALLLLGSIGLPLLIFARRRLAGARLT